MKQFVGPVMVLLVLSGILYVIVRFAPIQPLFPSFIGEDSATSMTVAHIRDDAPSYTVSAQYPQFGIPAIDTQVQQAMEAAITEFKSLPQNPPNSATAQNEFTGTFDKVYIGPDIVSVELVLSEYTGGAHPLTLLSGMNFNRTTGRLLLLDDALKLIGLTTRQVSERATAQFEQKFGDAFFADGANDNPENFSSFTISADKVTFIFQQYQVAAYAAGAQEASFPRK
ncbi:DUF3298 domain-containing protein [Candidatus Kaiserbacteria bacterium]|nr:DUF3298 domain-containing protein [Candidatus Kaiserbacteria bacterium]